MQAALRIAGSGMEVQSTRLRVISENVANAGIDGRDSGRGSLCSQDPFPSTPNWTAPRASGRCASSASGLGRPAVQDRARSRQSGGGRERASSKCRMSIFSSSLRTCREANRSYEANLQVVKQSGDLTSMTIGLLKIENDRRHLRPYSFQFNSVCFAWRDGLRGIERRRSGRRRLWPRS